MNIVKNKTDIFEKVLSQESKKSKGKHVTVTFFSSNVDNFSIDRYFVNHEKKPEI
ncbi:15936_t:CDS:2 [Cetraspora pellucida]|uniref:15936_t:CDS:1 n=1 Tax=Cetraspora pellucida TaxID=1433469 RepID=A0A9N8Z7P5_9GLOM|nr:15936_t:CDS:2 [Cetraspora pellucida]